MTLMFSCCTSRPSDGNRVYLPYRDPLYLSLSVCLQFRATSWLAKETL